jgi:hypothetical protein
MNESPAGFFSRRAGHALLLAGVLLAGCAAPRTAAETGGALQEITGAPSPQRSGAAVSGGLGFTESPDTVLLSGQVDFPVNEDLVVGPLLQLGLDDDETIVAPSLNLKHPFRLDSDGYPEVRPFVQGGAGFAYLEKERRSGDDDDIGLLLNAGVGVELHLDSSTYLSSTLMLNFLPGEVMDEDVFLSWQVIQLGWRF